MSLGDIQQPVVGSGPMADAGLQKKAHDCTMRRIEGIHGELRCGQTGIDGGSDSRNRAIVLDLQSIQNDAVVIGFTWRCAGCDSIVDDFGQ